MCREQLGSWKAHLDGKQAPSTGGHPSGLQGQSLLPWSFCPQILERLNKMCGVGEQVRKKQQRLLKNMDAHKVMLDLLQIPYEKVGGQQLVVPRCPGGRGEPPVLQRGRRGGSRLPHSVPHRLWAFLPLPQGDAKMMEILKFTHQFLQKFCAGNQENQALLHKHLNLFLTPGVSGGD